MPGGGTKLGITPNNPKAFCLDVTRLVRRTGRVFTGVDRVEWAYLKWCLSLDRPVFGLVRTTLGYLVLDRSGLNLLVTHVKDASWAAPGIFTKVSSRISKNRKGAESALRKMAIARALPYGLSRALRKTLPNSFVYFNVGHSNLTQRVFKAIQTIEDAQSVVLIHDMIPLTHPHFQRAGTVQSFYARMQVVSEYADALICNSQDTLDKTQTHLGDMGRMPPAVVAHLGTIPVVAGSVPQNIKKPYAITVGTLEPRKNHSLLLDIWEDWAKDGTPPALVICGARGWNNEKVFARIEALQASGLPIIELNALSDADMLGLVQGASAAVFPSFAEGFGLPQIEAAELGVPLICGDLDIYKEVLGDLPVYVDVRDAYSWRQAIEKTVHSDSESRTRAEHLAPSFVAPTWESHFSVVLNHFG